MHFRVHGKRDKIRFIVVSPAAQRLIEDYFVRLGHRDDLEGALFRPINNNGFEALKRKRKGTALLDSAAGNQRRVKNREDKGALDKHLAPASVYRHIVLKYGRQTGVSAEVIGLCVHSMRATAATNALEHGADIAKVQDMMGHANISTTRLYDRRKSKPEDSPIFRIKY